MGKKMIGADWKEFNPTAEKSMREFFENTPSTSKMKMVDYLNSGKVVLAAASIEKDVFTGEIIAPTRCILTDGEFSWPNSLGYYVNKYNLQVPKELEDKILKFEK